MSFNQDMVAFLEAALDEKSAWLASPAGQVGTVAASAFFSSFLSKSIKKQRFSTLIAPQLLNWLAQSRSKGTNIDFAGRFEQILSCYQQATQNVTHQQIRAWLEGMEQQGWEVLPATLERKPIMIKSESKPMIVVEHTELDALEEDGELLKPLTIYVRTVEDVASSALKHGLLLSEGVKKISKVKYHLAYTIYPNNQQLGLFSIPFWIK